LQKINEEIQSRELEKKQKKESIKREEQSDMDQYLLKKKDREEKENFKRFNIAEKVTLPLNHEERLEKYKEYMSKLTDKIDKNIGAYKNYHSRNHSVNLVNLSKHNNLKDEFNLDNQISKTILL